MLSPAHSCTVCVRLLYEDHTEILKLSTNVNEDKAQANLLLPGVSLTLSDESWITGFFSCSSMLRAVGDTEMTGKTASGSGTRIEVDPLIGGDLFTGACANETFIVNIGNSEFTFGTNWTAMRTKKQQIEPYSKTSHTV